MGRWWLCGLVEVAIHDKAPGCTTTKIGYLEAWYVNADGADEVCSGRGRTLKLGNERPPTPMPATR